MAPILLSVHMGMRTRKGINVRANVHMQCIRSSAVCVPHMRVFYETASHIIHCFYDASALVCANVRQFMCVHVHVHVFKRTVCVLRTGITDSLLINFTVLLCTNVTEFMCAQMCPPSPSPSNDSVIEHLRCVCSA